MSAAKSKSSVSEASSNKASPATPKNSKVRASISSNKSDADSPSPVQKPRLSVDQSPRSANSKPVATKTPKPSTTPDKQPNRILKGPELQAQLSALQEDLKKSKEKLVSVEKEKARAIEKSKEAQKVAEEAKEKLREALVAQKRAEEDSEIEKFRAVEIEQAGIEIAQKKEEQWQKELDSIRNQQALDLNALLTTTEELQRVRQELAMTSDAKNQALTHADDATKIAEIHVEKMEILSAELARVKALMESKLDKEANEKYELVSQLNSEVKNLKLELEKVKIYEEKLAEKEDCIEQLNVELEAAKLAELYAQSLAEEWKKKAEMLEVCLEEANKLEKSACESLEVATKNLDESNNLLHGARSENSELNEKVLLLETSVSRQRVDIEESEHRLDMAKGEAAELANKVENLKSQLKMVKEENIRASNNEKVAADSIEKLLEEKNKLVKDLESLRDEDVKSKEAMESLTAALHEVSSEARETKEKLLSNEAEKENYEAEKENYEAEMENLKFVLRSTSEKYEKLLFEAKQEIAVLAKSVDSSKYEHEALQDEWEKKELNLMDCVKQSEEERSSMEKEISRLATLLKEKEEKVCSIDEERASVTSRLKEAETVVANLEKALGEAKDESTRSKEKSLDKENELKGLIHENEELRSKQAAALNEIEELSKLLEESMARKQAEDNGEISDSEKEYDMLPKVVEFSEQNGDGKEEKTKDEGNNDKLSSDEAQNIAIKFDNYVGEEKIDKKTEPKEDDSLEVDSKMWESCKIEETDFSAEKSIEQESFEEGINTKTETGESYDHINGETSPLEQQSQKKKKPLLKKFGSLLKKKGTTNNQK